MGILTYLAKVKGKVSINKVIITSNNKLVNTAKKSTASNQLKTRNLSAGNLDGSYLSLQYDHVILVRGYPVWTAVNNHNMYVQYRVVHSHTGKNIQIIGCPVMWTGGQKDSHMATKIYWMDR